MDQQRRSRSKKELVRAEYAESQFVIFLLAFYFRHSDQLYVCLSNWSQSPFVRPISVLILFYSIDVRAHTRIADSPKMKVRTTAEC